MDWPAHMTVDAPKLPDYTLTEQKLLETFLLIALKEHDGVCLDNQPERVALAVDLAATCVVAVRNRGLIWPAQWRLLK